LLLLVPLLMILLRGLLAVVIAIVKAGDFVGSVRYLSSSTICFSDALYRKTLLETHW
jgi:hypothetical protein